MKWSLILLIYIVIEIYHYIKYLIKYRNLNRTKQHDNKQQHDRQLINKYSNVLKKEFTKINCMSEQLTDLFYGKCVNNNITKESLKKSISQYFYFPYHNNLKETEANVIDDILHEIEKQSNIIYSSTNKQIPNIDWGQGTILCWYKPIIIQAILELFGLLNKIIMCRRGFKKIKLMDSFEIWVRKGTNKNNGILFMHASATGPLIYSKFIDNLPKDKTIIIPEIPGIAFGSKVNVPPSIYEMSEKIVEYICKTKIKKIDMIGHSLGCNFITCILNRHYNKLIEYKVELKRTIIIDGLIFIPRIMKLYAGLGTSVKKNIIDSIKSKSIATFFGTMISIILVYRDMYMQYYCKRCFTITDSLLYGHNEYEKSGNIYVVFAENDDKICVDNVLFYLDKKHGLNEIKYNIKTFPGKAHGEFISCKKIQEHVLGLLE